MSNLKLFLKGNKIKKENVEYAPTQSLVDEKGDAIKWEFKALSTKESEEIREDSMVEVQVKGKPNQYRQKLGSGYMQKLIAASVVYPNLHDAELQNSYGVMKAEDLLMELIDDPGEYNELVVFVNKLCGFNSMEDKVEAAKN